MSYVWLFLIGALVGVIVILVWDLTTGSSQIHARCMIGEEDFRALVKGHPLMTGNEDIEITVELCGVSYEAMSVALYDAAKERPHAHTSNPTGNSRPRRLPTA